MIDKRIAQENISRYSSRMLMLLEREKIDSVEELQKRMGESFETSDGIIQLEARPSGLELISDSIAFTMSYIIKGMGIPIETILNVKNNYALMIVKSNSRFDSYAPDFYDNSGNIIQSKKFELSFERVKEELRGLSKQNDP